MKRELYLPYWNTVARIIKTFADWECQECGRPCLRPEQDWFHFCHRLGLVGSCWYDETYEEIDGKNVEKKGRFILTVAHLDQNPGNNNRENLKALCSVCHLRHDAPFNGKKAARTRFENQHKDQLKLF